MRRILRFILITLVLQGASLSLCVATASADAPHPTNAAGFITDGSPQLDDGHCVGTPDQMTACKIARRPGCLGLSYMTRQEAMDCWAPEINDYDWDQAGMFDALYCESKGSTLANNGTHANLFQSDDMPGDALAAFSDAYYAKWLPALEQEGAGWYPWRGTFEEFCPA